MARINFVTAIIGKRGCGKTTYVLQLINQYHASHPTMKILIVDTLDHPMYRHLPVMPPEMVKNWKTPTIYRMFGGNINEMLAAVRYDLSNCLVIFEDASKYVTKNLQADLRHVVYNSKQTNLDLIFLFHGFAAISPELLRMVDIYTLFKCDNPDYRRAEMTYYEEIKPAWSAVMKNKSPYFKKTVPVY